MNFWRAVKLARLGQTKEIETVDHGGITGWAPGAWEDYQEYCSAMDYLHDRHGLILHFLRWIKYF